MTNIIALTGSTLTCIISHNIDFAISYSDRSPISLFSLKPKQNAPTAMLRLLLKTLGGTANSLRRIVAVEASDISGSDSVELANATKIALVTLAGATGAQLIGVDVHSAVAIGIANGSKGWSQICGAIELHRRELAREDKSIGVEYLSRDTDRQLAPEIVELHVYLNEAA